MRKGFTLVELLVVLLILGIGLSSLLAAFTHTLSNSRLLKETVENRYQAETKLLIQECL